MRATRVHRHLRKGHVVREHARWVLPSIGVSGVEWLPTQEVIDAAGGEHLDELDAPDAIKEDRASVEHQRRLLREGIPIRPIVVTRKRGTPAPLIDDIEDGFHRTLAAKRERVSEIPAIVLMETG